MGEQRRRRIMPQAMKVLVAEMKRKLGVNAHKGGWRDQDMLYLLGRLDDEVEELKEAMLFKHSPHAVLSECADVANFAMMIADRYGKVTC